MPQPTVVILAAGVGSRMRSGRAKVLHDLCGRPMVAWPIAAALDAGVGRVVVVGGPGRELDGHLPAGVVLAVQEEARGTGDAVRAAAAEIDRDGDVIVLAGDVPLVTAEFIAGLAGAHATSRAAATMATMVLADATGYGRVVRDAAGLVDRVVETKAPGDATPQELEIREVNTGIFAFRGGDLLDALDRVTADNAQGEYYLPDVLPLLRAAGAPVGTFRVDDPALLLGVNDRVGLAVVRDEAQRRIHERHMLAGVTIVSPQTTTVDVGVEIGRDTTVEPCTQLLGSTRIGSGATVGPHSTVIDAVLGDEVTVVHSHLVGCELLPRTTVGPFAYLRPGAVLREGAKAGTFVEIKNADIGVGAKVPHLSYIGDTDIGPGTNMGAGSITANYDGRDKHRTRIGAGVHGGVHVSYVAPVTVGDGAWTAAGSVVTDDVEDGALAVARARQRNIPGYDRRRPADPAT
ncbi:MAG TPA: bifunctional UDP-N-acetylglucosamine diphosphorylase/glucosamine-1-phosphate N-acetyltransferase GlmU [Solirubrobacteraceae bacterium]|nr:bifunctional UDP-N-acetylglucosamine diphosphorylase/glucosamine-1-phosphate N-acetyltransferase GlmU [Solirubrobacteraceae bacterium]